MSSGLRSTLALLTLLGATDAANALVPQQNHQKSLGGFPLGIRVVRPEVLEASALVLPILSDTKGRTPKAQFQVDAVSGTARVISGRALSGNKSLAPTQAEDFEAAARAFVAANQELFPIADDELVLDADALHISKDDQFVKLRLRRNGLDIADASIDFRFKFGQLVQVASHAYTEAKSDDRPGIGGLERRAQAALIDAEVELTRELYRVVPHKRGYDLVRVTEFAATTGNGEQFMVQVESATGAVFEVRPKSFHLNGLSSASLHKRWYQERLAQEPLPWLNLSFNGGNVTTNEDGRFANAPQTAQPRLQGFVGPKVKVVTRSGAQVTQVGTPVRDEWHVVWQKQGSNSASNDTNVAQAMVFYHTNTIIAHAKEIIPGVRWLDRQLTANTNLSQTCNAHWDGSTINFYSGGSGCANTGLISDVVYHEWGHGLDDNTGGIEDGAFSEGFGDIVALAETGSNQLGIGFRLDGSPVRDLEPNKIYPRDADTEVHAEGLIIASTFYDLYKSFRETYGDESARALIRRLAMKVILTASRYTDVYDALLPIDDDNGNLNDRTPHYCAINRAFAAHGLARADQACDLAAVETYEIDDRSGNGNGVIEPGESIDLWLTARNAGTTAADDLNAQISVSGANGINVEQSGLRFGSVPPRETRRSETAAQLRISDNVRCGQRFTTTTQFATGTRSATVSTQFQIGRLASSPQTRRPAGLPTAIRDNQTTEIELKVQGDDWSDTTTVDSANLQFDISHTYVGDLRVRLVAPNGVAKDIIRGSGNGNALQFEGDISEAFAGVPGQGVWKLQIIDNAEQDEGTLTAFALTLTAARYVCE